MPAEKAVAQPNAPSHDIDDYGPTLLQGQDMGICQKRKRPFIATHVFQMPEGPIAAQSYTNLGISALNVCEPCEQ
jgi:hypothetical protein